MLLQFLDLPLDGGPEPKWSRRLGRNSVAMRLTVWIAEVDKHAGFGKLVVGQGFAVSQRLCYQCRSIFTAVSVAPSSS